MGVIVATIYFLLLGATALFVAPFHPLARVIVVAWILGHAAFLLGMPEEWVNPAQHIGVFVVGSTRIRWRRLMPCTVAWLLALPMIVADVARLGGIDAGLCWWAVLLLALVQLAPLPAGMDRRQRQATLAVWRAHRDNDFLRSATA